MAKRVSSTSVNWGFILESLLPKDRATVNPIKTASEKYLREIATKPGELPQIDWNFYKSKINASGMVDTFQKSYEALKVPYPSDKGMLAKIEASNKQMIKHAEDLYEKKVKEREEFKAKLKELESMMKLSETTLEELYLAEAEFRNDPDNPKLWPHLLNFSNKKSDREH